MKCENLEEVLQIIETNELECGDIDFLELICYGCGEAVQGHKPYNVTTSSWNIETYICETCWNEAWEKKENDEQN